MHPVYDCFDKGNLGKLQCISLVRHPHFLIELQCASSSSWILLLTAPAPQSSALWHFPGLRPTSLNCKQANKRKGSSLRNQFLRSRTRTAFREERQPILSTGWDGTSIPDCHTNPFPLLLFFYLTIVLLTISKGTITACLASAPSGEDD